MKSLMDDEANALEGWFSRFDMETIYPALIDSKADDVYLEIGVHKGRSLAFARKYFKGDVFGIDILDHGAKVKKTNFIKGDSLEVKWNLPIKVLFIDGEHRYERVKAEWEKYYPFVVRGGWVFFHDADESSPEVVKFTEELKGIKYSKNPQCSMAWKRKW